MRLIWYNRDEFSDRDIAQAKATADRLLGKRKPLWEDPRAPFFSGTQMQSPIQYRPTITDKEAV
jgi:hypothetical protein